MIAVTFEEIRPRAFDSSFFRLPLLHEMDKLADEALVEFRNVVKFWHSDMPTFERKLTTKAKNDFVYVDIVTDNPAFDWLDKGVKGHLIYPRKDRVSGTSGTYKAGSLPGTLQVNPNGGNKVIDGNYLNLNQVIDWPGIQARNWSTLIKDKVEGKGFLHQRFQEVLNRSAAGAWS